MATALCKRPPTHTSQSLHYHSPSDPRPVKAVHQGSYHRSLRDLQFRGDDTNIPTFIFRCVPGRGFLSPSPTPPTSAEYQGDRPVSATQQSSLTPSPPVDPAKQLLPRSFSTTLALLPSCCRRLQTYRHSVGWADDHTCSDCHAVDHMGWPTSSTIPYMQRTSPRVICGRHLSRSFSSWRAPTVCRSASNPDRFRLLPLFTLFWK